MSRTIILFPCLHNMRLSYDIKKCFRNLIVSSKSVILNVCIYIHSQSWLINRVSQIDFWYGHSTKLLSLQVMCLNRWKLDLQNSHSINHVWNHLQEHQSTPDISIPRFLVYSSFLRMRKVNRDNHIPKTTELNYKTHTISQKTPPSLRRSSHEEVLHPFHEYI